MKHITIEELYALYQNHRCITTDSRNCPKGSIFFALKGANFNGNKFAANAISQGCAYAIIDEEIESNDEHIFLVDNVLNTLQLLAHHHRMQLNIPIIGITGTNGKTTTKEIVAQILSKRYRVSFTQGNFNNHIGVPLTLLAIKPECEIAVIEMGANHPGEIRDLAAIVEPTHGLITNVGKAHLEGFGSLEGVINTKRELYHNLIEHGGHIFLNNDNPLLKEALRLTATENGKDIEKIDTTLYGTNNSTATEINGKLIACAPYIEFEWKSSKITTPQSVITKFVGAYNLDNMLAGIAVGTYFGVEPNSINSAIAEYQPSNNRSQLTATATNTLIVDTYNANPTSMRAAIDNFELMQCNNKVAILGDMLELGSQSHEEHQAIINRLEECNFEQVLLVGSEFGATRHHFTHYATREELIKRLTTDPIKEGYVLIKSSNGIGLQKIVEYL